MESQLKTNVGNLIGSNKKLKTQLTKKDEQIAHLMLENAQMKKGMYKKILHADIEKHLDFVDATKRTISHSAAPSEIARSAVPSAIARSTAPTTPDEPDEEQALIVQLRETLRKKEYIKASKHVHQYRMELVETLQQEKQTILEQLNRVQTRIDAVLHGKEDERLISAKIHPITERKLEQRLHEVTASVQASLQKRC
jgi:hypothetical protein